MAPIDPRGRWETFTGGSVSQDGYTYTRGTSIVGRWANPVTSGKVYVEVKIVNLSTGTTPQVGWVDSSTRDLFDDTRHYQVFFYAPNKIYYSNNVTTPVMTPTSTTNLPSYTSGSVLMLARDHASGKFWFGLNGKWSHGVTTQAISAGTATTTYTNSAPMPYLLVSAGSNNITHNFSYTINQGQVPYAYTPPVGFGPIPY